MCNWIQWTETPSSGYCMPRVWYLCETEHRTEQQPRTLSTTRMVNRYYMMAEAKEMAVGRCLEAKSLQRTVLFSTFARTNSENKWCLTNVIWATDGTFAIHMPFVFGYAKIIVVVSQRTCSIFQNWPRLRNSGLNQEDRRDAEGGWHYYLKYREYSRIK